MFRVIIAGGRDFEDFVGLELDKEPTADSVEFSVEFWSVDTERR